MLLSECVCVFAWAGWLLSDEQIQLLILVGVLEKKQTDKESECLVVVDNVTMRQCATMRQCCAAVLACDE